VSVEQGATVYERSGVAGIPFVGAAFGTDTQRQLWNNRAHVDAGVKLAHAVPGGIFVVSTARRYEVNVISHEAHASAVVLAELWVGWNVRITPK
jgi:hypothetical protein